MAAWLLLAASGLISAGIQRAAASTNVMVWDTSSAIADPANAQERAGWKPVPVDLLKLEADPAKAASDPGYYGRDYSFKGDAVVENRSLTAMFWSAQGRVVIYSKAGTASPGGGSPPNTSLGRKVLEFAPLRAATPPARITRVELLRNVADEVVLDVSFAAAGSPEISALFSFGKTEIVEIKPSEKMKEISLLGPIEYGVVPNFIGDDLIFGPGDYPANDALTLPSENLFLGLVKGENDLLVMTWPKGRQRLKLRLGPGPSGGRIIESVDFDPDGQSLYLAALGAPGIWHKEPLKPSFLEKDVAIQWKRPFPARWTTQLSEAGVRTTFTFKESKAQIWRGVPGSYSYPVWFEGDQAFYRLSKKVPPKGESLIYFREGQDTPLSVSTPVDILKATLGRPMSETVLDTAGRKLRTHHRRPSEPVHRACTCGYTEAIQAVFEAREETAKKEFVAGALEDMIYFVRRHVERIDEYRHFADDVIKLLRAQESGAPELKPYLDQLAQIAQQIPDEYNVQKENMKTLGYADDLARQTIALTGKKDANNLKAYMDLLKLWRAMGGAQDYVVAQCHGITRKLFQEAGYGCATQPKAVELAEEIRRCCRQVLRNPDGYEIWANY